MVQFLKHGAWVLFLTLLTQLGGLAWLGALMFRRRWLAFGVFYVGLAVAAIWVAPVFGRVPLSCWERGPLQVQSWFYCALNRTYVTPELAEVLYDTAAAVAEDHPDTVTLMLDGSFPFMTGFPLLPHLSHDDGEKADLAFYYRDEDTYLPAAVRAPLAYFAFEEGESPCRPAWLSMRWDMGLLQRFWRDYELDAERMTSVMTHLSADPRVGKIFLEPHLVARLGVAHDKVRFQGCRAARHDDHIHFQL